MSDGSDLGVDPTYDNTPGGQSVFNPPPSEPETPNTPDDTCGGLIDIGGILDLGGLIGSPGSLIDVEFGQGDGHTAAILDVVLGDGPSVSLLGSDILGGGGDVLGSCGLLDGLFDNCSLLS